MNNSSYDETRILNHFSSNFDVSLARSIEDKEEVFRIRYLVYCREFGYEPVTTEANQMERDAYDNYSAHCIIRHSGSDRPAGCVRVILPNGRLHSAQFPFERITGVDLNDSDRQNACEVSRLAVPAAFRRRAGESQTRHGVVMPDSDKVVAVQDERRCFPVIAIGLYLAATAVVLNQKLMAYSLMEKRLARHLKRNGLPSRQLCPYVEHKGARSAFQLDPQEVLANISTEYRLLYDAIEAKIVPDLAGEAEMLRKVIAMDALSAPAERELAQAVAV